MTVLISLLAFIVTLGVLVTLHEYGHFWVARRCGVFVERFSVGFGKPIWSRTAGDGTEFVVARIPLGGYVKMDEDAFRRARPSRKIAISLAGPAANFAFAILAYWVMFMVGIPGLKPVVGEVAPGTPAAAAGLERGDQFVRIAGDDTPTWEAALLAMLDGVITGAPFPLEVANEDGVLRTLSLSAGEPHPLTVPGALLPGLGITPWIPVLPAVIESVEAGSPAAIAGLAPGDRVTAFNGEPVADWTALVERVRGAPDARVTLSVMRDGRERAVPLTIGAGEDGNGRIGAGVRVPDDLLTNMNAELRYAPLEALGQGVVRTGEMSVFTVKMLGRMLTGDVSVKNISGPINIAQYAGYTASIGLLPFIAFMAIVSISLGIINLLPVPILDGGHLVYHLAELVTGRPASEQAEAIGQRVGIGLLAALMGLAIFNDLARILG
ncbi:MAG: RIP metalloprotease RseP [Gammaproteobacteria bacterium]